MRVLVACECSGEVRRRFRARGHDAWSCDLKPADDGSSHHWQADVLTVLQHTQPISGVRALRWDLIIAHPPCPRLCLSGVLRLYRGSKKGGGIDPVKWAEMQAAAQFFRGFFAHDAKLCVENPRQHGYALRAHGCGEPTQVIQPYDFGDDASKTTCLWLRGLPPLCATHVRDADLFAELGPQPRFVAGLPRYANQTDSGQNKLAPSPTRSAERAKTYAGIAEAMAEQWG